MGVVEDQPDPTTPDHYGHYAYQPDPQGSEPFGGYESWERWRGLNCYGGRGGAVMPGHDPDPQSLSLSECMDLCDATADCDGIQTHPDSNACWLRMEVDIQDCYEQQPWIMYTRKAGGSTGYSFLAGGDAYSPVRVALLILEILLVIGIICLAVCLCMKKKLLCFKEKEVVAVTKEEAKVLQEFDKMDKDGDGVVTEEEFMEHKRAEHEQRQCGRSCQGCWDTGSKDQHKPKEPEGQWVWVEPKK